MTIDGQEITRCPRRPLLEDPETYGHIFWLYRQYQKGYLPEVGGLNHQPHKFIECVRIIDHALDFCKTYQDEDQRKRDAIAKRAAERGRR